MVYSVKHMLLGSALALSLAISPLSAQPPHEWDGLVRVKAKHMDAVYLLPQADFTGYTKVMLDPTEVAFRKDWQRDTSTVTKRISDEDARRILESARTGFEEIFRKAYVDAGYQVVTTAGPDVLRIETAVINLDVQAPDIMTAGRSVTFSSEAGSATLAIEARDSVSGALLGRAVDEKVMGDLRPYLRNSVTNSAEFEEAFSAWAKRSAAGLGELKALSPIDANGKLAKH
ncbi:MAG TPA: DUF3313 family protein [Sphingobium sp.]|uniref:DUF3313 family protein n=1 Tax=Sphingobium sp. TaxID=1912891 RepID=UPI002ED18AE6